VCASSRGNALIVAQEEAGGESEAASRQPLASAIPTTSIGGRGVRVTRVLFGTIAMYMYLARGHFSRKRTASSRARRTLAASRPQTHGHGERDRPVHVLRAPPMAHV